MPRNHQSVARHVISILVALIALVLAGLGAFYYLQEKQRVLDELRESSAVDGDQLASGLALSIWNLDEAQARKNIESVMRDRNIEAIEVQAKGLETLRLGRDAEWKPVWSQVGDSLQGELVEDRSVDFSGEKIGTLRLVITPRFVMERLQARLTVLVCVFVFFEFCLALGLTLLIWRSIIIPLKALDRYAVLVSEDSIDTAPPTGKGFRGELETLRASIEKMVALLGERYRQLNREVSLRSESEQQLRSLYDSINDGIMILDPCTGRMLDVNSRACAMHGCSRQELLQSSIADLSSGEPPHTQEEGLRRINELNTTGPQLFEWHCRRRDGSLFWGEISMRRTETGSSDLVLIVLRDITERRNQEEERRRLEAQLSQSQKLESIGILAGGIAHDFNNILSAILGFCELSKVDAEQPSLVQEYVGEIRTAATRARDLVGQILTFSRRSHHHLQPVHLTLVVKEVLKLLRATYPASIEIEEHLPPQLPLILADPSQLHQVLMNLCSNAEHAMKGRKGRLRVSLEMVHVDNPELCLIQGLSAGAYLRLSVADSGHGMDAETLKHIFDPFFTTKRAGEGTGLGMAVVHGIVKSHRGSITIESTPGLGSIFHVFLPVIEGQGEACTQITDTPGAGHGERVLFVDNELILCRIAEKLLRQQGYEATIMSDPLQALALPEDQLASFDLLITDLSMPGLSGLELATSLRARRPDLPVVIMTGYIGPEGMAEARNAGIAELIMKPLESEVLSRAISRHVRRRVA